MKSHVAVLMGGFSAEREVSLVSGENCAAALEEKGYRVTKIDVGRDLPARLAEVKPDVVFNALHGRMGEDGRVQGLLDLMAIPYTHSGVLASALAMDKPMAMRLFRNAGLVCPEGFEIEFEDLQDGPPPMEPPFVVKPAAEGSSVNVLVAKTGDISALTKRTDIEPEARFIVERFIPGHELTATVLGEQALTVTEIRPKKGRFYDYGAKYTEGFAEHIVPAPLPRPVFDKVCDWALRAHWVLGCRGVSRADFRFDPKGGMDGLVLLEVNTQPGMTPMSLVPEQAKHCGIPFADLVVRLVEGARCDK